MNYGLSQMTRGRFPEARDLFLRAGTLLPNYSFLEVNLGVVYSAMHDSVEAERHFQRSLSLEEGQPVAHRLYARFLLEQARGPQAIVELGRARARSPGEMESRHMLLAIHAARASTPELRALVDETLRLDGNDPDALAYSRSSAPFQPATDDYLGWFNLGFSFTRAERHLDAAPAYRVAVARDSTQAEAWNNLGWTLGRLGFFDDGIPALQRAIQLRPNFPLARNNLAWAMRERARR
jgi:Flp pilus assembly protein TadD